MILYVFAEEKHTKHIIDDMSASILIGSSTFTFVCLEEQWFVRLPYGISSDHETEIPYNRMIRFNDSSHHLFAKVYCVSSLGYDQYENYEIRNIRISSSSHDDIVMQVVFSDLNCIDIDYEHHLITSECAYASLNGKKIHQSVSFHAGDRFELFGLVIIFTEQFVCINQTENIEIRLKLYERIIRKAPVYEQKETIIHDQCYPKDVSREIRVNVPKEIMHEDRSSFLLTSGPLIMMASGSIISTFINEKLLQDEFSVLQFLSHMLLPIIIVLSALIFFPLRKIEAGNRTKILRNERDEEITEQFTMTCRKRQKELETYIRELNLMMPEVNQLIQQFNAHLRYEERHALRLGLSSKNETIHLIEDQSFRKQDLYLYESMKEIAGKILIPLEEPVLLDLNGNRTIRITGKDAERMMRTLIIQAGIYDIKITLIKDVELIDEDLLELSGLMDETGRRRIFQRYEESEAQLIFTDQNIKDVKSCSVITTADCACDILISCDEECFINDKTQQKIIHFIPEYADTALIPYGNNQRVRIYDSYSLFDMYDIEKISDLNLYEKKYGKADRLIFPFGKDEHDQTLYFDLSEYGHGPHGLIAGVTGSGKSELILSMLISMMMTYTSEEVQIAIIDFKGGGISGIFSNHKEIPHIAGILSNLDILEIRRALVALKRECEYREIQLANMQKESGKVINHLSAYRNERKQNDRYPLITDLVIVVDEFAELKRQYPQFMDELISIARIGRSLGLHLILSTQKPAGIINDQIRSNCNFKISLKVNDVQDSMDVLHVKDAAYLKEKGSFVMSSDQGIIHARCAYSSYQRPLVNVQCCVLDRSGNIIKDNTEQAELSDSEIEQVLRLIEEGSDNYEHARSLWLPVLHDVKEEYLKDTYAVGMIDDYMNQRYQELIVHPRNNLLILNQSEKKSQQLVHIFSSWAVRHQNDLKLVVADENNKNESTDTAVSFVNYDEVNQMMKHTERTEQTLMIMIMDARRFYEKAIFDVRRMIEENKVRGISWIFVVRHDHDIPYRDARLITQRWCLSCDNRDEISDFFGKIFKDISSDQYDGILYDEEYLGFVFAHET